MTDKVQGQPTMDECLDEASINELLDGVRSANGVNNALVTAITSLNKRETRNSINILDKMNKIIDSITTKIID